LIEKIYDSLPNHLTSQAKQCFVRHHFDRLQRLTSNYKLSHKISLEDFPQNQSVSISKFSTD